MNAQSKIDKVKRYKWRPLDAPGQFRMINKHDLVIPTDHYQRVASTAKVRRIAANFSWAAFQVISVSEIDGGKYHVIEGGHRTRAAMERSDINFVPCMVFQMPTIKDEAEAFLQVNVNRQPMRAVDRHRAYIAAGDEVAIKVEAAVRQAGRKIDASQGPNYVTCVNELRKCIVDDAPAFNQVWPVVCSLCEGHKITRDIVIGLFWLHRKVEGGIASPKRAKRICEVGFMEILEGSRQGREYHGHPGASAIADGMLKKINHGLRNKWKLT